jgi:hypothetical protein
MENLPLLIEITGGKEGFLNAIDDAFKSKAFNPVIRYSHSRGFHVESKVHPSDPDVIWSREAYFYSKDSECTPSIKESEYQKISDEIIDEIMERHFLKAEEHLNY